MDPWSHQQRERAMKNWNQDRRIGKSAVGRWGKVLQYSIQVNKDRPQWRRGGHGQCEDLGA